MQSSITRPAPRRIIEECLGVPQDRIHLCALHAGLRIMERMLKNAAVAAYGRDNQAQKLTRINKLRKYLMRALHRKNFVITVDSTYAVNEGELMEVDGLMVDRAGAVGANVSRIMTKSQKIKMSSLTGPHAKQVLEENLFVEVVHITEHECVCAAIRERNSEKAVLPAAAPPGKGKPRGRKRQSAAAARQSQLRAHAPAAPVELQRAQHAAAPRVKLSDASSEEEPEAGALKVLEEHWSEKCKMARKVERRTTRATNRAMQHLCRRCRVLAVWQTFKDVLYPLLTCNGVPKRLADAIAEHRLAHELILIKQEARRWLGWYIVVYGDAVTPYVHIVGTHLHELLSQPGHTVGGWAQQGFEAAHKRVRRVYQHATGHGGGVGRCSALLQILQHLFRTSWFARRAACEPLQKKKKGAVASEGSSAMRDALVAWKQTTDFDTVENAYEEKYPKRDIEKYVERACGKTLSQGTVLEDTVRAVREVVEDVQQ